MNHSSHAVFSLQAHLVFVTKYRKKVITPTMLQDLEAIFTKILVAWKCTLLEFGGEADHVHLLISYHPNLNLSVLVNNLKSVSLDNYALNTNLICEISIGNPYFGIVRTMQEV